MRLPPQSPNLNAHAERFVRTIKESCLRSAIVVMPAQPFLDWLQRVDPTSVELRLEDLRRVPTIYLLPECENEEEACEYLCEVCDDPLLQEEI